MKKNTKFWIVATIVVIIGSNLLPLTYFFPDNYTYQNIDGTFQYTEHPDKGLDFEVGEIRYNRFLKEHPGAKNKQLYRKFHLKHLRFWAWSQMINNSGRYNLPILPLNN